MTESQHLEPLILGRRIRHYRNEAELTLDQLGSLVGKPAPYLSLLENGKKEPRVNLVMDIAKALGVEVTDLLDLTPPTRRDALEIELIRAQETTLFESLDLPAIKPSAKVDNQVLAHIVGLHEAIRARSSLDSAGSTEVREANGAVHEHLTGSDGYLRDIEVAARDALTASGHTGEGPFSSRNLIDLAASFGFELMPIEDMPSFARSIIDTANKRIYIAQRNELRTRQARKAVLQTVAGFALGHETDPDLGTYLRQRMETAYFAAAVLAPEDAVVARLLVAKENHDIDVEDVKELFYLSYEMAAWRTANLLTRHLGIYCHLLVSDEIGSVVKGYSNDGAPVPRDEFGGMETQRLCRWWGARMTFDSQDRFATHHQYTDTPAGTYFCTTHIEAGREPAHGITLGVGF
ncbi:MAG TPA: helix-turn-helix domain-containing protein, partial [Acidimicrobiia bacterium]|nr:helix-turn-helix domain-containing protein [Acidimicrobiia bacterium]